MNKAVGFLTENFLEKYFLIESVCLGFLSDSEKKDIFGCLADVFCIEPDDRVLRYYDESEKGSFLGIQDIASYERLCRIIEFAELNGQGADLTECDRLILSQKRLAVKAKEKIFKHAKNMTKESIVSTLQATAVNGNLNSMALLAFMEYHGICIAKDTVHAQKLVRLCAKWNNTFGNLMGIAYDSAETDLYRNILFSVFKSKSGREAFGTVCDYRKISEPAEKNRVACIIEKAFALGIIDRDVYDPVFAEIAFSELINDDDKQKILLNRKKEALSSVADYPFDAKKGRKAAFSTDCTKNVPIKREKELAQIGKNMTVTVNCPARVCKPLYIVSADSYMTEQYADMLKEGITQAACVDVDVSTLTVRDFSPERDNLFLRTLSDTKTTQTFFLLRNCSETDSSVLNELVKMTDYAFRSRYRLSYPAIAVDLSELKFVFFSAKPIKALTEICDTVSVRKISQEEKKAVAEVMLRERSAEYGLARLTVAEDCLEYLVGFDVDKLGGLIDEVIREAVFRGTEAVTADWLTAFCSEQNPVKGKTEFGFMGGNNHA